MTALRFTTDPADAGLDPARWGRAEPLVRSLCGDAAAAVCAGTGHTAAPPVVTGSITPGGDPATAETRFLVASLTKPVVATLALAAVERGELSLGERVADRLPAFRTGRKRAVRVRHLLTHTSGLPDLLPDDLELRRAGAPLRTFLDRSASCELTFEPGRAVAYSSLGFAVLWDVLTAGDEARGRDLLRDRLFAPLGMTAARLGGAPPPGERIARIRRPARASAGERVDVWNDPHWPALGAPWGGMVSTVADIARFVAAWSTGGALLSEASVRAATTNALAGMRHVSEEDRRCRPWGLGWRLAWPAHAAYFGDLLPSAAFGHWGSTGCVTWCDPAGANVGGDPHDDPAGPRRRDLRPNLERDPLVVPPAAAACGFASRRIDFPDRRTRGEARVSVDHKCPPGWRNWQTRWLQVPVGATPWRFESSPGHFGQSETLRGLPPIVRRSPGVRVGRRAGAPLRVRPWGERRSTAAGPAEVNRSSAASGAAPPRRTAARRWEPTVSTGQAGESRAVAPRQETVTPPPSASGRRAFAAGR